jgi:predicted glycoside hydrolase/deacetylase ChbG (UPF0249 family)
MFDCIATGRVIINGDDFGMSPGINAAVERLHQAGRLSSVSIISNMPWSDAALDYAARAGDLRTGVHLNLTTGQPRLPLDQTSTLVNQYGQFMPVSILISRLLAGRVDRDELRHELEAQIEAALDAGLTIDQLDSHMHFHAIPRLSQLVTDLAHRYGVPTVRNPDFSAFVMPPPSEIGPVRNALTSAASRVIASTQRAFSGRAIELNGPATTGRQLVYLRWCLEPGPNPPAETFRSCICNFDTDNLEIIAHPAMADDVLSTLSNYVDGRQTELEFLASDDFGQMLEDL